MLHAIVHCHEVESLLDKKLVVFVPVLVHFCLLYYYCSCIIFDLGLIWLNRTVIIWIEQFNTSRIRSNARSNVFTQIQFLLIHGLFAPCPPGMMDGNRHVTNKDGLLASVWGWDSEQPRASHVVVRSSVNGYHNLCHISLRWDCCAHYTDNTCRNTFYCKTSKYIFLSSTYFRKEGHGHEFVI